MRQLFISDGTAVSYSSGELAAGAVDIVKRTDDGFTSLAAGETISDSDAIKVIQGTASGTANLQSPWIPGSAVKRWTGKSYQNQAAQVSTVTLATSASAAFEATIKVVRNVEGQAKFERKSWTVSVPNGSFVTDIATLFVKAMTGLSSVSAATTYDVVGLDWLDVEFNAGVITLTGSTFVFSPHSPLASFRLADENLDGTYGTTSTLATTTTPFEGYGDPEFLKVLEEKLWGMQHGYYNRIQLPLAPTSHVVLTDTYDIYNLSFENPEQGQIRGVDNMREIVIAYKVSGTGQGAFEGQINGYMASCPGAFAPVNL